MPLDPEKTGKLNRTPAFPIVAIGTSAGGIQALQTFFETIPADTGAAFVVILHLDPEHRSDLSAILATRTRMPVAQVEKRIAIEPNHVYVIPPNRQLIVSNGALDTCEFEKTRRPRAPIDHFFRSLAGKLVDGFAVILTGAGSDGAVGVKAIKEAGGLILVQDPKEAEYPSMPRAAMATGCADDVLPLRELAERLAAIMQHKHYDGLEAGDGDEELLRSAFSYLRARTGHDFSKYKRPTILRRLARRMQVKQVQGLKEYLEFLRENPAEI